MVLYKQTVSLFYLQNHFLNELTYPIGWLLERFKGEVAREPAGLLGIEPGNSSQRDASQRETEELLVDMDKISLYIVLTQQYRC